MRVALAQLNLLVGDVAGNAARAVAEAHRARDEFGARLVVFPELTLTGYPPEDLLLHAGLRAEVPELSVVLSLDGPADGAAGFTQTLDRASPRFMPGMKPLYMCRSDPQIAVDVTRTIASC